MGVFADGMKRPVRGAELEGDRHCRADRVASERLFQPHPSPARLRRRHPARLLGWREGGRRYRAVASPWGARILHNRSVPLASLEAFFAHALVDGGHGDVPLVDSGHEGLIIADTDGRAIYASAEGHRLLFLASNPRVLPSPPLEAVVLPAALVNMPGHLKEYSRTGRRVRRPSIIIATCGRFPLRLPLARRCEPVDQVDRHHHNARGAAAGAAHPDCRRSAVEREGSADLRAPRIRRNTRSNRRASWYQYPHLDRPRQDDLPEARCSQPDRAARQAALSPLGGAGGLMVPEVSPSSTSARRSFSCFSSAQSASGIATCMRRHCGGCARLEGARDHRGDERVVQRELQRRSGQRHAVPSGTPPRCAGSARPPRAWGRGSCTWRPAPRPVARMPEASGAPMMSPTPRSSQSGNSASSTGCSASV